MKKIKLIGALGGISLVGALGGTTIISSLTNCSSSKIISLFDLKNGESIYGAELSCRDVSIDLLKKICEEEASSAKNPTEHYSWELDVVNGTRTAASIEFETSDDSVGLSLKDDMSSIDLMGAQYTSEDGEFSYTLFQNLYQLNGCEGIGDKQIKFGEGLIEITIAEGDFPQFLNDYQTLLSQIKLIIPR